MLLYMNWVHPRATPIGKPHHHHPKKLHTTLNQNPMRPRSVINGNTETENFTKKHCKTQLIIWTPRLPRPLQPPPHLTRKTPWWRVGKTDQSDDTEKEEGKTRPWKSAARQWPMQWRGWRMRNGLWAWRGHKLLEREKNRSEGRERGDAKKQEERERREAYPAAKQGERHTLIC